jgi:hypothetical protein
MLRASITLILLLASASVPGHPRVNEDAGCHFDESVRDSRPGDTSDPTEVLVGAYLLDLPRIDDAEQSYLADVFFRFTWTDPRLAHAGTAPCKVALDSIWYPATLIANQRDVRQQLEAAAEIQPDGSVRYVQRFQGTFSSAWDLRRFPFDAHQLPVTLVVRAGADEVRLVPDDTLIRSADKLSNPNWRIGQPVLTSGEYPVQPGRNLALLEMRLPVERRSGHYVWKLIVPMSMVVFMSWAAFWISPQHIAPRVGLSATSMLTLIAFRLALGNSLPPIPYLTQFDVFIVGATLLVFLALAQTVATSALWDQQRHAQAKRVGTWSKQLFPLGFAATLLVAFGGIAL